MNTTAVAAALLLQTGLAAAVTIDFEDLAPGTVVAGQYTGRGVTFAANAFSGGTWATNTDMHVVDSAGDDVGALGEPAGTVAGNVLRSFAGWLEEDGDASFWMNFGTPISSISVAFAGVNDPAEVKIRSYDGATLLGERVGAATGQFTLSFNAARITRVAVAPGDVLDWVAVDNIVFAPVPEPGHAPLLMLGLAAIVWAWRQSTGRASRAR